MDPVLPTEILNHVRLSPGSNAHLWCIIDVQQCEQCINQWQQAAIIGIWQCGQYAEFSIAFYVYDSLGLVLNYWMSEHYNFNKLYVQSTIFFRVA